jgi:hypothetical protein
MTKSYGLRDYHCGLRINCESELRTTEDSFLSQSAIRNRSVSAVRSGSPSIRRSCRVGYD